MSKISLFTIYVLVCTKLIAWALAMILINASFQTKSDIFLIGDAPVTKYLMLATGVLGLLNIKINNRIVYTIISIIVCFLWVNIAIGFGLENSSFYRNIPETIAVFWMAIMLQTTAVQQK